MRSVLFVLPLILANFAGAAVLPEGMGSWKKDVATSAPPLDAKVWREFGFQDGETTAFIDAGDKGAAKKMSITAWHFADATGAMAAFDTIRPEGAKPSALSKRSVEDANGAVIAVGNYLFRFDGLKPNAAELNYLVGAVPRYRASLLPTLPQFLPQAGRVANSERYILGPESLQKFSPVIPPSTVGFHFGAEGELVRFGKTTLVVFNYPSMEMARDRLPDFQKLPGAVVKRSGPLLAVALNAPSPDAAERLLSQVKYQAEVTIAEKVPTKKDNPGNFFVNVAILVGVLAAFCIGSGLVVGGLKYLFRSKGADGDGEPMISLHLGGR